MSKRLVALLAGALAISLIAAGCGSDDNDGGDGGETSSLTKAQFIQKADTICQDAVDGVEAEVKEWAEENDISTEEDPSKEVREEIVSEVLVPNVERQADDIEALGFPSGDEETVEALLAELREGAGEIGDDPSAVAEGDQSRLDEAAEMAEEYGLKVCGEN